MFITSHLIFRLSKAMFLSLASLSLIGLQKVQSQEINPGGNRLGFIVTAAQRDDRTSRLDLYEIDTDGVATRAYTDIFPEKDTSALSAKEYSVNTRTGKVYFMEDRRAGYDFIRARVFDIKEEKMEGYVNIDGLPLSGTQSFIEFPTSLDEIVKKTCVSTSNSCANSNTTKVTFGADGENGIAVIDDQGLSVGGANLIKRTGTAIHIGENSLVTDEVDGVQQLYATDGSGKTIDIDITKGSRLLINGRDVEKSIDNVGALSAALSSVPAVSADSQFTCGFGGGTHSSAYALSAGCASRVSDRFSVNAALATVVNNQTGDKDDNLSARAGFTFRLGKIDNSPKVAARKAAELRDEVAKLREENLSMRAESLMQKQINSSLAARLEQLERIASSHLSLLGDRASSD